MTSENNISRTLAEILAVGGLSTSQASPSPPPSNALASLASRPTVAGLYYNGQTVQLDGYKFVGCRFDNCLLKIKSSNFELERCVIDDTNQIEYGGGLVKVVKLFLGRYAWAENLIPKAFLPVKNLDGTESIVDGGG